MSDINTIKCIPCDGWIPGFDITEIHKYLKMVDGWEVKASEDKVYYLIKNFKFKNFLESQNFVNKVGEIAEKEGHHPDLHISWGKCVVELWTHKINGLHDNDFYFAAKADEKYTN